jgi:hypothetical protein
MFCTTAAHLPTPRHTRIATIIALCVTLASLAALGSIAAPARAADEDKLPPIGACANDTATPAMASMDARRLAAYCLINNVRYAKGLHTLRYCQPNVSISTWPTGRPGYCSIGTTAQRQGMVELSEAAQHKAPQTATCPYTTVEAAHTACDKPMDFWPKYMGYSGGIGEILYWGTGNLGTALEAVKWWLGSPKHHDTMLDVQQQHQTIGIGLYDGPLNPLNQRSGQAWAAQLGTV